MQNQLGIGKMDTRRKLKFRYSVNTLRRNNFRRCQSKGGPRKHAIPEIAGQGAGEQASKRALNRPRAKNVKNVDVK